MGTDETALLTITMGHCLSTGNEKRARRNKVNAIRYKCSTISKTPRYSGASSTILGYLSDFQISLSSRYVSEIEYCLIAEFDAKFSEDKKKLNKNHLI